MKLARRLAALLELLESAEELELDRDQLLNLIADTEEEIRAQSELL